MSKIVISTDRRGFDLMVGAIDDCFSISHSEEGPFGFVQTYSKLNIATKNYYCIGQDFAMGVGTFVCDGLRDAEALRKVLELYVDDVRDIQKRIVGCYAIFLRVDGRSIVFTDDSGIFDLYYQLDDGKLLAANSFFFLSAALSHAQLDPDTLVQIIFQNAIMGDSTFVQGVKRLGGDQCLVFDNGAWRLELMPQVDRSISYDDSFWPNVATQLSDIKSAFNQVGVAMTGGQDSRLVLALMLSLGIKPHLIYWIGNSTTTNTKQADMDIVQKISARLGLDVEVWDASDSSKAGIKRAIHRFGEYYLIYGYNESLMQSLRNTSCDFISFGYFGEMVRNCDALTSYEKESFSVEEYFDDLYNQSTYGNGYREFERCREEQLKQLKYFCQQAGLDSRNLTKSDYQRIYTSLYLRRAHSIMDNFANNFVYASSLLSNRAITDSFNHISYSDKIGSTPMLKGLKALAPALAEVPFYSRMRELICDLDNYSVRDAHDVQLSMKAFIQEKKRKSWYYPLARRIYHMLSGDKKSLLEVKQDERSREELYEKVCSTQISSYFDMKLFPELVLDGRLMNKIVAYEELLGEMGMLSQRDE